MLGAQFLAIIIGGFLSIWIVLGFLAWLVMALLERSDADIECEAPLKALERIEARNRHPSVRGPGRQ